MAGGAFHSEAGIQLVRLAPCKGSVVRIAAEDRVVVGLALATAGMIVALAREEAEPAGSRAGEGGIAAGCLVALRLLPTRVIQIIGEVGISRTRERERPRKRCKVDGFLHWTVSPLHAATGGGYSEGHRKVNRFLHL